MKPKNLNISNKQKESETMSILEKQETPIITPDTFEDNAVLENVKESKGGFSLPHRKVILRYIKRNSTFTNDPKHALYGGLMENSKIVIVCPLLSTGSFARVLTEEEQAFLEETLGFEKGYLSPYAPIENNYWNSSSVQHLSNRLVLGRNDVYLDLSDPHDYIRYKIALANDDIVSPSQDAYKRRPKATQRFVIVEPEYEQSNRKTEMSSSVKAYVEFGKISSQYYKLRAILEQMLGKRTSHTSSLDTVSYSVYEQIGLNPVKFLNLLQDNNLHIKAIIINAMDKGLICYKGNGYYFTKNNLPLCENNQDPTLENASRWLGHGSRAGMLKELEQTLQELNDK